MEIQFWPPEAEDGPILDFIQNLDNKIKKKILRDLEDKVAKYDLHTLIRMGIIKRLTGVPLYEIISRQIRILMAIRQQTCWLLHGFVKKSNHTPRHMIDTAMQRSRDIPQ